MSSDFEKQRNILIQEISNSINSIVLNLNSLNRSLNNSIQVGKDFENVSSLWSNFYNGLKDDVMTNEEEQAEPESEIEQVDIKDTPIN